jgi:P4 family phage/plasmid primase-like protien
VLRTSVQKERDKKGKLSAKYITCKRAPSENDVQVHLAGKVCIVAKPELADDTCTWAMLDFDIYLDSSAVLRIGEAIDRLALPLHPFPSKSGGLHCAAFFAKPVACSVARAVLSDWKARLGYANMPIEIFPKPVAKGKLPFGIALPFFGEPERFKTFEPKLYDVNGWTAPNGKSNIERETGQDETQDKATKGVVLPEHIKDFEVELANHGLKFRKRAENGGTSFDYHNIEGQPCLLAGVVHETNKTNARCSRFFEKDRRVIHHCFDDDGSPGEHRTRKALAKLGIDFEPAALPLEKITDAGNAELLVAAEGDDLRYCFEMKKWLVWDKRRWLVDEKQTARVLMEETMRARVAEVVVSGSPKQIAVVSNCLDTYRITNGLHEAEKKLGVAATDLDTHPFLITFKNGTLDLETMTLGPHKREHLITKMIQHNYKPEAKLPRFLGLLEHAVGKEAMPYIQKLLGYSLTGETSEKTFIVVWGAGDTGKTTFLEIVRKLLEEYAVLLQVDTLMDRRGSDSTAQEDLAALRGTRIATTSELDQGRKLSIAVIKRIVQGQGKITASAKYEKKITFPETHKLWFDTNHLPMIPADEQAVWNRVAVVVFGNPVPRDKQDRKLAATILNEEAEGILAWMAEGERLRQKEGLGEMPESFKREKEKWQKKMDVIQQFIDERCEKRNGLRAKCDAVYQDYVTWNGNPEHAISRRTFTVHLANLGIAVDKGRRYYEGLALIKESDEPAEKTVQV